MRSALVTGVTGLVGSHIAERLLQDGWHVRALVRDTAGAGWLQTAGAELAHGDILDGDALRRAAAGCEVIFHAAALVTGGGDWESFRRANIDGTAAAIDAAERAQARLVQVSSVAVYGTSARYRDTPTDEDTPVTPLRAGNHYGRSKRDSEQMALAAHASGRIWATAIRPDVVYGRRDRQFVPRAARVIARGVVPLIDGGVAKMAIVHAANVADGAVRAAVTDCAGGRTYNLANDYDITVAKFVRLGGSGLGRAVHTFNVPVKLARAGIGVAAWWAHRLHGASFAAQTRASLDFLTRDNPFTSERARRELGWNPPVAPETGVPEAFAWWKEHGRS